MTDLPVPSFPPEPTDDLIAEVESAMAPGAMSDLRVMECAEGLHAIFHALGLAEMHIVYWTEVQLAGARLEADATAEGLQTYCDFLRDWVRDVAHEVKEWLIEHEVPKIEVLFATSIGELRTACVEAS